MASVFLSQCHQKKPAEDGGHADDPGPRAPLFEENHAEDGADGNPQLPEIHNVGFHKCPPPRDGIVLKASAYDMGYF